jgi:hypothetical protein
MSGRHHRTDERRNESQLRTDDSQGGGLDRGNEGLPRSNGHLSKKTKATIKAGQEQMGAEIMTDLEETKVIEPEVNQEKIESVAGHYKGIPRTEITQEQAPDVLCADTEGATYEETIVVTEDRLGDQNLVVGYCSQRKTWAQDDSEPLQEFSIAIELVTHGALPAQHENHICREPDKTFCNGIKN